MQTVCTDCGGTVIEYDAAAGNGFCVQCGTVVEENTIVNEVRCPFDSDFSILNAMQVTFGETSTGAAMVQGSFVAQGASTSVVIKPLCLEVLKDSSSRTDGRHVR